MLKRKRVEFIDTITRGLNSFNDTPPTLKKYSRQRWKYLLKDNIQNEDEFKNTIALSIRELNPKNPWIVDKKGRHTNLLALLNDWPELEQDLESILTPSKEKNSMCAKWDCGNVRAVNTLSGSLCNYCSIKCMKLDHNAYVEQKKNAEQQQQLLMQQQMKNSTFKLDAALEAAIESRAASIAASSKKSSASPSESPCAMLKSSSSCGSKASSNCDESTQQMKMHPQKPVQQAVERLKSMSAKMSFDYDEFVDMGFKEIEEVGSMQSESGDGLETLKQALEMSHIDVRQA
jgi:hypothetical protein